MKRLYTILHILTVFMVGAMFIILINQQNQSSEQIKQLHQLSDRQAQTINEVKRGVAVLKTSNDQQTAYLQCLMEAQNLGDFPGTCQPPESATTAKVAPQPSSPATSSVAPAPTPAPTPAPSHPGPVQGFLEGIKKVLGL